jgi:hypothetical protein
MEQDRLGKLTAAGRCRHRGRDSGSAQMSGTKLVRYCARPPLANEHLRLRPDG